MKQCSNISDEVKIDKQFKELEIFNKEREIDSNTINDNSNGNKKDKQKCVIF